MEDHASDNTDVPRTRTFYLQQTVYKVQDMDKMKEGIFVYRTLLDSDFVQSNPELIPIVGQYVNDARVQGKFEVSPWHAAGANIKIANEKGAGEIDMTVEKFIEIAEKFNKEEDEQRKSKQKYLDNEKKYLGQVHPYKVRDLQVLKNRASLPKERKRKTVEGLLLVPPEAMQRAARLMMDLSKWPLKLRPLKSLKLLQSSVLAKSRERDTEEGICLVLFPPEAIFMHERCDMNPSAIDMFFNKFPTSDGSDVTVVTLAANCREMGVFSAMNLFAEQANMEHGDIFGWIFSPSLKNELITLLHKIDDEFSQPDSYAPYLKDLGLAPTLACPGV
ncbi:Hypothetical predicted protein [Cloeon dipterum]|uniref:Rhabdovirus nucleocapsid domain-containing protein n=1 Tax=Cloeon dipterum TaxID=197152 RepID=A0A8S1E490_9INSE|nr:Hypothetical predicted protein [Cloeon dipterum]CAB3388326.1 Hypothetical predicted protein [Cloeon dipterum]